MKLPTTTIATDIAIASSENDVLTGWRSSCRSTMRATLGTSAAEADPFQNRRPIAGRRLGPHRLGRRQPHGQRDRAERPGDRRAAGHEHRVGHDVRPHAEDQLRILVDARETSW